MIKITFPQDMKISSEALKKHEASLLNLVSILSEKFDITGLSEISIVESIATPHNGEFVAAGEIFTTYGDIVEYKIQVVGTIFDPRLAGNKQVFYEFAHMLRHELAHIDDHNRIVHIYKERDILKKELSQDNVMWEFTLKIWSEFMATQLSADQNALLRIEHNIIQLNNLYVNFLSCENKQSFAIVADMICYMAYLLGDILIHEEVSDEIDSKIDVGEFSELFQQLYDELQSLLLTYPNWENIYVLKDLRNVIQSIINMSTKNRGDSR